MGLHKAQAASLISAIGFHDQRYIDDTTSFDSSRRLVGTGECHDKSQYHQSVDVHKKGTAG